MTCASQVSIACACVCASRSVMCHNHHPTGNTPICSPNGHVMMPTHNEQHNAQHIASPPAHNNAVCNSQSRPPIPKSRVIRPRLSISPIPILKEQTNQGSSRKELRPRDSCKPADYRRHIEQHLARIARYLKDRENRRYEIELKFKENSEAALIAHDLLAERESKYLRSLRSRMSRHDFQDHGLLGAGFIGEVRLVSKKSDLSGQIDIYAMKIIKKSQVLQQNHMAHVMAERDILAEANNEWVVKLFYSFQDRENLYFIMEYIPGGDLMHLLCQEHVFSEDWARFYIAEISLALQFVHDKGYIHRDIKPDNILIDSKGHLKLTDFGLCTGFKWTHDSSYYRDDEINEDSVDAEFMTITHALSMRDIKQSLKKRELSLVGSPNYIAPEVLRQASPYAYKHAGRSNERLCDWWSVGVILYEMVIGYCPFINWGMLNQGCYDPQKDPPMDIQMRIVNWKDTLRFPSRNDPRGPPLSKPVWGNEFYISHETQNLIQGLLCDPKDRLCQNGIADIMHHPFFRGIDWNNIRSTQAPHVPVLRHQLDRGNFDSGMVETAHAPNISGTGARTMGDFTYRFWGDNT